MPNYLSTARKESKKYAICVWGILQYETHKIRYALNKTVHLHNFIEIVFLNIE